MQYDTYAPLLDAVAEAWRGVGDIKTLNQALVRNQSALALTPSEPSKEDRAKVESGTVTIDGVTVDLKEKDGAATRRTIDYVLSVSETFALNELHAVRLIWTAAQRAAASRTNAEESFEAATRSHLIQLHFTQRYNLLVAVLDLLLIYSQSNNFEPNVALVVREIVQSLFRAGLVRNLLNQIKSIISRIALSCSADNTPTVAAAKETAKFHERELLHSLRILIVLTSHHSIDNTDAVQLIRLIQTTSSFLDSPAVPNSLSFANYSLLSSWIACIELKYRTFATTKQQLEPFFTAVNTAGEQGWSHEPSQALHMLAMALFHTRIQSLSPNIAISKEKVNESALMALSPDVQVFTRANDLFFESSLYSTETRSTDIAEIWGSFINSLFMHFSDHIALVRDEERRTDGMEEHSDERNFDSFLAITAHLCRQQPNVGVMLLNNSELETIIGIELSDANSNSGMPLQSPVSLLESPTLFSHVNLLCALSACGDGAIKVFQSLRSSKELNWDTVFVNVFQRVVDLYGPQQPNRQLQSTATTNASRALPKDISEHDSKLLCSLLRLLCAVSLDPSVRATIHQTPEYRALDRLFALLGSQLDVVCKAACVDAINALSRGVPSIATSVLSHLQQSHILPGAVSAGKLIQREGIVFDLEEVEARLRQYPLTLAFARLCLSISFTLPVITDDFIPFVQFLRGSVFLSLNDREYVDVSQRWKLAETCLALFDRVIRRSLPVSSLTSPGAALIRDILSGRELLVKVLETLSRAYQLIEQHEENLSVIEIQQKDLPMSSMGADLKATSELDANESAMSSIEGSLRFAVALLAAVAQSEDACVAAIRSQDSRTRIHTLTSLLFQHPQEIIIISYTAALQQAFSSSHAQRTLAELDPSVGSKLRNDPNHNVDYEDDLGYIAFDAASILQRLVQVEDARVAHLYQASSMSVGIANVLARLVGSLQSDDEASHPFTRLHQARLVVLRTICDSVLHHSGSGSSFGLAVLGFHDALQTGSVGLDTSRTVLLDCLVDMAFKPHFASFAPQLATLTFELFARLLANGATRGDVLALTERKDAFFVSLLAALPTTQRGARFSQQRRWLLDAVAVTIIVAAESNHITDTDPIVQAFGLTSSDIAPAIPSLALLDSFHVAVVRPSESVPPTVNGVSLAQAKQVSQSGNFEFDVEILYHLLTTEARLNADQAKQIAQTALEWNRISLELTSAVQGVEACRRAVQLAIAAAVQTQQSSQTTAQLIQLLAGVLERLTVDDTIWIACGDALSSIALAVISAIAELDPRQLGSLGFIPALVAAIIAHRAPNARLNLYACLARTIQACDNELTDNDLHVLLEQNVRALHAICDDAKDGAFAVRSMALTALEAIMSAESKRGISSSIAIKTADQRDLLRACIFWLKQSEDAVIAAIESNRTDSKELIAQFVSMLRFLRHVAVQPDGSAILAQREALNCVEAVDIWLARRDDASERSFDARNQSTALVQSALQLVLGMIASSPFTAINQHCANFIIKHSNAFAQILKNQHRDFLTDIDGVLLIHTSAQIIHHIASRVVGHVEPMPALVEATSAAVSTAPPTVKDGSSSVGATSKVTSWLRSMLPGASTAAPSPANTLVPVQLSPVTESHPAVYSSPVDSRLVDFLKRVAPLLMRLCVRFAAPQQESWFLQLNQTVDSLDTAWVIDQCLLDTMLAVYHMSSKPDVLPRIGSLSEARADVDHTDPNSLQIHHLVSTAQRALEQAASRDVEKDDEQSRLAVDLALVELSLLLIKPVIEKEDDRCARVIAALCQTIEGSPIVNTKSASFIAAMTRQIRKAI